MMNPLKFKNLLVAFTAIFLLVSSDSFFAQPTFNLQLIPQPIPNAPALQSYAYGTWGDDWLLLGGRVDGLHQRQPFAAFDEASQNARIYVLNPVLAQVWSAPLSSLPVAIAEQLRATNLEFVQRDSTLYLIGGYGYSPTAADHLTHPQLLAVQIPQIIHAIKQAEPNLAPYFQMLTDDRMAVTGGQLELLGEQFYLVGGQRFDGRYNPMNHPTFVQEYTDQVRIFDISQKGDTLALEHYRAWTDANHLHRRDYNLVPQIFPNGQPGLSIFSGVFQLAEDIPWLYPVDIDTGGYTPRPGFKQYLNHYHCATAALFQASTSDMHSIFFGGMAQYFLDTSGNLVQDANVPFVNTIARVTRDAKGELEEVKLPVEMPGLTGAGAEFILHPNVPVYANGVVKLDELDGDSVLLGYIFGGIRSPQANIFFTNIPSTAEAVVYAVWLQRSTSNQQEVVVQNPLGMLVSPNPTTGDLLINYNLPEASSTVRIRIWSASGQMLGEFDEGEQTAGPHFLKLEATGMPKGFLLVNIVAGTQQQTQKVLFE
ncbi:MAG: T9SS type A sorting domain-containing protein [Saprospiraceae bacterium]|nr:T9SS type A sorting domain-containing protein [Saprospiraceae bacterium]